MTQKKPKRPSKRPKLTKKNLEGDLNWRPQTTLNESSQRKSKLKLKQDDPKTSQKDSKGGLN